MLRTELAQTFGFTILACEPESLALEVQKSTLLPSAPHKQLRRVGQIFDVQAGVIREQQNADLCVATGTGPSLQSVGLSTEA